MGERGEEDSYSKHKGSKKKLKLRVAKIQPIWTKSFQLLSVADGEDGTSR